MSARDAVRIREQAKRPKAPPPPEPKAKPVKPAIFTVEPVLDEAIEVPSGD